MEWPRNMIREPEINLKEQRKTKTISINGLQFKNQFAWHLCWRAQPHGYPVATTAHIYIYQNADAMSFRRAEMKKKIKNK